jgi:extracellular elastinolytic metalloproteinase
VIREVDTRDATFIRGEPELQDEIVAVAREVSDTLGMQGLEVKRLNPATATVAELRCLGPAPPGAREHFSLDAQAYVQAISAALGSGPDDVVDFAPDPVVQRTSTGAVIVHLHQVYRGVPVFRMTRTVTFAPDGRVTRVKGNHAPLPPTLDIVPVADAVRAVQAAGLFVAQPDEQGQAAEPPLPEGWTPTVVAAFALPSQPTVLDAAPFVGLTPTQLVLFYQGPTVRLGWQTQLNLPPTETSFGNQYAVVVAADRKGPDVLFCRRSAHLIVEGEVFERDPVRTPRARIAFPLSPSAYRLPVRSPEFPRDWCYGDETEGRNVRAIHERTRQPARGSRAGGTVLFTSAADDDDDQHVINAFYFCNYLHDFFELLGFDEAAGNFEVGSATATGGQGDPVLVMTHPRPVLGVAYMTPNPDGRSPRLGLGSHADSQRHSALDFTVVAHEYSHGVADRLVGGPGVSSALAMPQSAGFAEGIADFFALSIVNFGRPEGEGELQVIGDWVTDTAGGMRRHRYDGSYPATYGKLGSADYREPHDIGELWCASLMELIRRWSSRFGTDRSYPLCWRVVLDSLKVVNTPPSLLDARDALEEALDLLGDTGELDQEDLKAARRLFWETFARFGMGFGATTNGASLQGIVESTRLPPRVE